MRARHVLLAALSLSLIVIAACAPVAAPPAAPTAAATQPTAMPAPATAMPAEATAMPAAPTSAPAAAFTGDKLEAPNCDYKTGDKTAEFKSIEAVDQYTVKFTLCKPDPAFLAKVAFAVFAIQDKDYLTANGGDSAKMSDKPNGTGPYMVTEWVRGDHLTMAANPDYWGDKAKSKTLIFRWSKEAAQRLLELQAGTVDGIDNPAPDDFPTIEKDTKLQLIPRAALNVMYIGLNNAKPPFDNEKVRQAIAMAIDKDRIVKNFYAPGSAVAEQFVPPSLKPGFSETGDGASWYKYDPEAAKKLLAEAGFPNGFETTFSFRDVVRSYVALPSKVVQDIQAQLADIGVKVNVKVMESGPFLESVAAGNEPMFLLGWGADYPDSTNFYDFHFTGASKNFGTPYSDLVDEIHAAAQLSDPAERQKHYDQVNKLVKQHVPMIPVAHGGSGVAFKATVQGAHTSPIGNEKFAVMSSGGDQFVWMQNAEPIQMWCGDETDGETLRACLQVYESLFAYEVGGVKVVPALAEKFEANQELTEWTFTLRKGVKFHNGAELDANDVVASYSALWDATNPNHKGNTGVFEYFGGFFGAFLNSK